MDYTKEEIEFIKEAFKKTRTFFEEELHIENSEDVIKAINLWNNKLGLGPGLHEITETVFNKNGYFKDGKTTLEQHKKNLFERKIILERRPTYSRLTTFFKHDENILINFVVHSAYHRGQIALLLRAQGIIKELPETDFNPYHYQKEQN